MDSQEASPAGAEERSKSALDHVFITDFLEVVEEEYDSNYESDYGSNDDHVSSERLEVVVYWY